VFVAGPSSVGPAGPSNRGLFVADGERVSVGDLVQMTAGRVERFPRISGESFTVWEERREERLSRLHDEGYYNFEMWPADMLAPDEWAVLYAASGEPAPRYLSGEQMAAENIRLRSDGCPTYMFATTEDAVMNLANDAAYLPGCTEEEYEQRVEQGVNHGEFVAGIDGSGTHSATFVRFTRGAGSGDEVYLTYGWGFWADTVAAETGRGGRVNVNLSPARSPRAGHAEVQSTLPATGCTRGGWCPYRTGTGTRYTWLTTHPQATEACVATESEPPSRPGAPTPTSAASRRHSWQRRPTQSMPLPTGSRRAVPPGLPLGSPRARKPATSSCPPQQKRPS